MRIDIGNGATITSAITNEAIDELAFAGRRRCHGGDQGFRRDGRQIVRVRCFAAAALTAASLTLAGSHAASAKQNIVVATSIEQSHNIDPAMIEQLPPVEERVSFLTGHGPEQATYTGALLWSVLDRAKCWAAIAGRACAALSS